MIDHRPVGGGFWFRALIKAMVEDGFDRGVGARAKLKGAVARRLQALGPITLAETDNPPGRL